MTDVTIYDIKIKVESWLEGIVDVSIFDPGVGEV